MRSRLNGFLMLLTLLTSCTTQSSTDQLTHELQSVKSWAATTNMVADAWGRGAIPSAYAKQTLVKAQQELQTEIDNIKKIRTPRKTDIESAKNLVYIVSKMSIATGQILTAIKKENRTAVTQQLGQLSIQEQTLDKFEQSLSHEKNS